MGCICSKRKRRRIVPVPTNEISASEEVTIVEVIYIPRDIQPAMEEPRQRDNENEILERLKDEGILKSETLRENTNGSVAFYVSLDGNAYPSGKPRLLEPIELKQERDKLKGGLSRKMWRASKNRRNLLATVERRARMASAKVRQAKIKVEKSDQERRLALKEKYDRKMEQAARNRLEFRGK